MHHVSLPPDQGGRSSQIPVRDVPIDRCVYRVLLSHFDFYIETIK
jgi:hypothetical protein